MIGTISTTTQVGERDGRRQRVLGHVSTLPVALAAAYRGGP
ncbi:hypothetical protein [Phycicoccus sp.]|nr:hypothetical protein [Phycicoccus sp.]